MSRHTVILWLFVVVADVTAVSLVRFLWRKARQRDSTLRIRFGLLDLLAATFGFAPTLYMFGLLIQKPPGDIQSGAMLLLILIPHQIAGIFVMALRDEGRIGTARAAESQPPLLVLGGALLGMFLPMFTLTFAMAILCAFFMFIALFPIALPLSIALGAHAWKKRAERAKADANSSEFPPIPPANK